MPSSVVVAHSFFLRFDSKQMQKMKPYPPLATLYVAGGLRAAGHHVEVFDAMLADDESDFETLIARVRPDVVVLYEDNFNFLSKMCLSRMRQAALTMASAAKRLGSTVIASGSDVSDQPEVYLSGGVDYVVFGEGDHTVVELVAVLAEVQDLAAVGDTPSAQVTRRVLAIDGLATLGPLGDLVRTAARRNERHPDGFVHPARDLIDIEPYRQAWMGHHGSFSLNMVSTRGCPFHCNWCAKPIWGQRYAMRSPADVADELASVKRDYRPDHIWFADDIFGLRTQWVVDFAREVTQRDAVVPFTMQSRCDLMTSDAVTALAAAGCHEVWMGAESGSQRILDSMDKGITVDEIGIAREALRSAGIKASFFIQFGYPGETWQDIQLTIEMVRELLPDDIGVSVSYPLPGTRFHSMVIDEVETETNWHESGDLQMLFRGTYTTAFYRALHLALHDDVNLHRRRAGLSAIDHPSLPPLPLTAQETRVATAWGTVVGLESSCRNTRPTLLVRAESSPAAPDLTRPFN